jgi:hypothetical protein
VNLRARIDRLAARIPDPQIGGPGGPDPELLADCLAVGRVQWREIAADWPTVRDEIERAAEALGLQDEPHREVVAAWDRLPEAVRAGIVAMVKAASGS